MSAARPVAFCIAGWHFPAPFYRELARAGGADCYVVAHRPAQSIPPEVCAAVGEARLFAEANYGYDWGCYQQFLERGLWRNYEVLFFMHDDIRVKDWGFVDACIERLERGASVVGNGRQAPPAAWPARFPQSYAHAAWLPPRDFVHDTVRGSFFAATRRALEALGAFEVFWDRRRLSSGFGNWSLRASCARWQQRCGPRCFDFLSEEFCRSDYLEEMVRGGGGAPQAAVPAAHRALRTLCALYTRSAWAGAGGRLPARALAPAVRYFAGRPPAAAQQKAQS